MLNIIIMKKMKIKAIIRYCFTSPRMAILKKIVTNFCEDEEKEEPQSLIAAGNVKWNSQFWQTLWQFLKLI